MIGLVQKPLLGDECMSDGTNPADRNNVLKLLFNEGSGTIVSDLSGNGYNLTAYNSPTWGSGKFGADIDFVGASNHYLKISKAVISGPPFTIVCWFKPHDVTVSYNLVSICDQGTNIYDRHLLNISGAEGGDPVSAYSMVSGTTVAAHTSNSYIVNKWHMACGRWFTATDRRVVLDADFSNEGTDTTSCSPVNLDRTLIGAQSFHTYDPYEASTLDGEISHVIIWNRILTDSEIALPYREPFGDLGPRIMNLYVPAAGGAGTPLLQMNHFNGGMAA